MLFWPNPPVNRILENLFAIHFLSKRKTQLLMGIGFRIDFDIQIAIQSASDPIIETKRTTRKQINPTKSKRVACRCPLNWLRWITWEARITTS